MPELFPSLGNSVSLTTHLLQTFAASSLWHWSTCSTLVISSCMYRQCTFRGHLHVHVCVQFFNNNNDCRCKYMLMIITNLLLYMYLEASLELTVGSVQLIGPELKFKACPHWIRIQTGSVTQLPNANPMRINHIHTALCGTKFTHARWLQVATSHSYHGALVRSLLQPAIILLLELSRYMEHSV